VNRTVVFVAAALLLAAGLFRLAHDIRSVGADALRTDAGLPTPGGVERGAVERLLSATDERHWREALGLARAPARGPVVQQVLQRDRAQAAFTRLAKEGPARARSRAITVLALLQLASAQPEEVARVVPTMLDLLRRAVRLDPANDDAAYDLELLLQQNRGGRSQASQRQPQPPRPSQRAGASTLGSGY
jgi:hypothetical protein